MSARTPQPLVALALLLSLVAATSARAADDGQPSQVRGAVSAMQHYDTRLGIGLGVGAALGGANVGVEAGLQTMDAFGQGLFADARLQGYANAVALTARFGIGSRGFSMASQDVLIDSETSGDYYDGGVTITNTFAQIDEAPYVGETAWYGGVQATVPWAGPQPFSLVLQAGRHSGSSFALGGVFDGFGEKSSISQTAVDIGIEYAVLGGVGAGLLSGFGVHASMEARSLGWLFMKLDLHANGRTGFATMVYVGANFNWNLSTPVSPWSDS